MVRYPDELEQLLDARVRAYAKSLWLFMYEEGMSHYPVNSSHWESCVQAIEHVNPLLLDVRLGLVLQKTLVCGSVSDLYIVYKFDVDWRMTSVRGVQTV